MKLKRLISIEIILIAIAAAAFFVYHHPISRIDTITVNSLLYIDDARINEAVVPYKGRNLLATWISGKLKSDLTRKFIQIEKITFKLRPRVLTITITEKGPWVAFMNRKTTVLVAKDGTILNQDTDRAPGEIVEKLLIIRGLSESYFETTKIHPKAMRKIGKIVDNIHTYFPDTETQVELNDAFTQNEDPQMEDQDLVIRLQDTLPVKIGSLNRLEPKFRTLKALLNSQTESTRPIAYIDLRIDKKIFVKYENRR